MKIRTPFGKDAKDFYTIYDIPAPKKCLDRENLMHEVLKNQIEEKEYYLREISQLNDSITITAKKQNKLNKINVIILMTLSLLFGVVATDWIYQNEIKNLDNQIERLSSSDLAKDNIALRAIIKDKESRCLFGICLK